MTSKPKEIDSKEDNMNWQQALNLSQNQINDIKHVGFSYIKQGSYDIALKFFQALHILQPQDPYNVQILGAIHLQTANHIKALEFLDKALKLDPRHLPTLLNKARTLFFLGYKQQALHLAQFLSKQPDPEIQEKAKSILLILS